MPSRMRSTVGPPDSPVGFMSAIPLASLPALLVAALPPRRGARATWRSGDSGDLLVRRAAVAVRYAIAPQLLSALAYNRTSLSWYRICDFMPLPKCFLN